jgi:hypothetical protein
MNNPPADIRVKQFGPQLQILDHGRTVAVAIAAEDGSRHRLIAATSQIGTLMTYLSRARTRAMERAKAGGVDHQITTSLDTGNLIEPKSVTLAVAKDASYAVLQVSDAEGAATSFRLTPELTAALAQQMARASVDMAA